MLDYKELQSGFIFSLQIAYFRKRNLKTHIQQNEYKFYKKVDLLYNNGKSFHEQQ